MVSYVECRNFMRNVCDTAQMSCEVAALPFQAHANYGTWSIDFALYDEIFDINRFLEK